VWQVAAAFWALCGIRAFAFADMASGGAGQTLPIIYMMHAGGMVSWSCNLAAPASCTEAACRGLFFSFCAFPVASGSWAALGQQDALCFLLLV
jgi:hypothetical protein